MNILYLEGVYIKFKHFVSGGGINKSWTFCRKLVIDRDKSQLFVSEGDINILYLGVGEGSGGGGVR